MKPNALLPYVMAMSAASEIGYPGDHSSSDDKKPNRHRKIPLTKKQIKAKAAAKRAKQARKINRK